MNPSDPRATDGWYAGRAAESDSPEPYLAVRLNGESDREQEPRLVNTVPGAPHGMGDVLRFQRVPREERTRLPGHLWWAIIHRDDHTCQWCHLRAAPDALEVDHIIPYSAGGMDNSPNLRTLCRPCNQNRSNYATWEWSRPRPVVATCQGATDEASAARVTVYCLGHRSVESVPDYFAQSFELARTLGREVPARPADPITYPGRTLGLPTLPEMI